MRMSWFLEPILTVVIQFFNRYINVAQLAEQLCQDVTIRTRCQKYFDVTHPAKPTIDSQPNIASYNYYTDYITTHAQKHYSVTRRDEEIYENTCAMSNVPNV